MAKLIGTAPNQVPTNADLGKLAFQDAIANGTGTAGQLLQSGGATGSPAWATVSSGTSITFPSNWASPTTTYTSSGTWSKGSLSDDAYVWLYLIGGGGGGSMRESASSTGIAQGGAPGGAFFIYGKAGVLNGTVFTIGAAVTGRTAAMGGVRYQPVPGNVSTFQMPTSTGGSLFATPIGIKNNTPDFVKIIGGGGETDVIDLSGSLGDFTFKVAPDLFEVSDKGLPAGVTAKYGLGEGAYNLATQQVCIWGGGNGGGNQSGTSRPAGVSEFAGNGGANAAQGVAGTSPGGGGGGSTSGSNNGGAGTAGILRQYNV